MKVKILVLCLFSAFTVNAGTPGNSDVSILYGLAMLLLFLMFGVDNLIKYMKNRRHRAFEENMLDESDNDLNPITHSE